MLYYQVSLIKHSSAWVEVFLIDGPTSNHPSTKPSTLCWEGSVLVLYQCNMKWLSVKPRLISWSKGRAFPSRCGANYPATLFQHRSSLTLTTDDNETPHILMQYPVRPSSKDNIIFLCTTDIKPGKTLDDELSTGSSCNPCDCLVACDSGPPTAPDIWTIFQTATQCF